MQTYQATAGRRHLTVRGLMPAVAVAAALIGSVTPAHADDTITIGDPDIATITAPASVAPGDDAILLVHFKNTQGIPLDSVNVFITADAEADASVDVSTLSFSGESHTESVNGDDATRTITVSMGAFAPGEEETTTIYLPFKATATGSVPLSAGYSMFAFGDAYGLGGIGDLTINAATAPQTADVSVDLAASPRGIGIVYATFTATATNHGPAATTATTIQFAYPAGFVLPSATGCTVNTTTRTATCDLGAIPVNGTVTRTLGLHTGLLTISSHLTVTATRTASSPADGNAANDSAHATCTALTALIISC